MSTQTERLEKAKALEARLPELTESPEKMHIVMSATAFQYEMAGRHDLGAVLRQSAGKVRMMRGMEAPHAWTRLSWRERFKNRKRRRDWEAEYTLAREAEGRQLVLDTLKAIPA